MKYIIGLGNPVGEYKGTRHNVASDFLLGLFGADDFEKQGYLNGLMTKVGFAGDDVFVLLPQTFMNLSGESVASIEGIKKVLENADDVLVVHDEIDIPFGEIKFSHNSGAGGHNGVSSIIEHLGTQKFSRLRIGVAPVIDGVMRKPTGEDAVAKFVLKTFTSTEQEKLDEDIFEQCKKGLETWVKKGWQEAANKFNSRTK